VVYVSAEDSADLIIKPRAVAAGADLPRFAVLRADSPDIFEVEHVLDYEPALVIFDPISAFIRLRTSNEHGEIAIRQGLLPFDALAQRHGVAVTGVRHVGKDRQRESVYDVVLGSRAWTAAARALLFFAKDRDHPDRPGGLIFPRSNLAKAGAGIRYRLDETEVALDDGEVGRFGLFVIEEGGVSLTLEEALGPKEATEGRTEAEKFLQTALADGPVPAADLIAAAGEEGIAEKTLRRAKKSLGVISNRDGFGKGSVIRWSLP
jgi:putative DNA primase/helicase